VIVEQFYGLRLAVCFKQSSVLATQARRRRMSQPSCAAARCWQPAQAWQVGQSTFLATSALLLVSKANFGRCAFSTRIRKSESWVPNLSTDATKPADRISRRILRQVISTDPIASRHALALAVEVARKVHPGAEVPELPGGPLLVNPHCVFLAGTGGIHGCGRSIQSDIVCTCAGSAWRARGPWAYHC
jgi:hypothetical protein